MGAHFGVQVESGRVFMYIHPEHVVEKDALYHKALEILETKAKLLLEDLKLPTEIS